MNSTNNSEEPMDILLRHIERYAKDISREEAIEEIEFIKGRSLYWEKTAKFVYKLLSNVYRVKIRTELRKILEQVTGYKKSQIYNFYNAGEKIRELEREGTLPAKLPKKMDDFLNPKSKPAKSTIDNIVKIGEYNYCNESIYIYSGEMKRNETLKALYFKSEEILSLETIEIETQIKNIDGKESEKKVYTCSGKVVDLRDFEPRMCEQINERADR